MTFGGRSNNIVQLGREAVVEVRSLGGVAARWLCRHTGGAKLVLIKGEGGGCEDGRCGAPGGGRSSGCLQGRRRQQDTDLVAKATSTHDDGGFSARASHRCTPMRVDDVVLGQLAHLDERCCTWNIRCEHDGGIRAGVVWWGYNGYGA